MTLNTLNFFSEPGVYEVETDGGPVYDIDIPEDLTDTGAVLISKEPGKADAREGREMLTLLEVSMEVGEPGELVFAVEDGYKPVKTKTVTKIVKVA